MNVKYTEINSSDAARMLGVTPQVITSWCRKGLVNHVNLSNGNQRGRYMLSENEVEYIKGLIKEYGVRKCMMYYEKDRDGVQKVYNTNPEPIVLDHYDIFEVPVKKETKSVSESEKITDKIMRIQDIKDRFNKIETEKKRLNEELENLDAEKNQLNNELETLRDEIMDWL